ncbi:helix-turn-helix domain-containing protein [Cohnella sp. CFH 77786]|uniref:helix-turn-helix domain-containing protein n=1 Tax=Cohnella sp. CFH 77786 TaxID=2662265 RepID=UPI001C60C9C3|nr:helix-turn-helix domain-containing protein [Cohnella sp. CFH 77786]MBW5447157.1 helix-turn-helix domain-containing protein [Cohnella sp. CFH 77786]
MNRRTETAAEDKARGERKSGPAPFPFARMLGKWDALDRLDLRFRWGGYGIRVLRCHLTVFQPGQIISFHKHSEYEFHFIPKGKGKVILEDQLFDLHEGLFYLTGPDVVHYQESDPDDPMHELCLHCEIVPLHRPPGSEPDAEFGGDLERNEAEACMETLRRFPLEPVWDTYNAMGMFLEAYRLWEEEAPGFHTLLKMAVTQILLRSTRLYAHKSRVPSIPMRDMNDHRFQLASQFIQDNESLPISLEEVAERVNVSPRQLQRIFRTEGQTTFREYVEHVRLGGVCADLVGSDRPIEEIALAHGYATPNYLFPVFKNKFGMTPTAYRRAYGASGRPAAAPIRKEERS